MSSFYPSLSYITNISKALQAVVTFDDEHDFTDGEIISLRSSRPYGMYQVNNMQSRVLSHTSDTVTLEIDTRNFTTFVYPPVGEVVYPAIAVPSASGIIPGQYTPTMNLEDAFDNVPA